MTTNAAPGHIRRHPFQGRAERLLAFITCVDGIVGVAVCVFTSGAGRGLALLSLLALLAATATWRARPAGHTAALVFYGAQLAAFYPLDGAGGYQLRGALSVGAVLYLPNTVLVLNVFAIAMFVASAVLLCWRLRGDARP